MVVTKEALGEGSYPGYHGLWHLKALGVVDDLTSFASATWDAASGADRPVRIGLIDTSVAVEHPVLEEAIRRDLAVDFASTPLGAFAYPDAGPGDRQEISDAAQEQGPEHGCMPGPTPAGGEQAIAALRAAMVHALFNPGPIAPAVGGNLSTHATAMAGIIAGRPALVDVHVPQELSPTPTDPGKETDVALPYSGIDPFAEIVPISTSSDPRPLEWLLALLYADLAGVDIIVLAADLPRANDERRIEGVDDGNPFADYAGTGHDFDILRAILTDERAGIEELWGLAEAFLRCLSLRRPVLCAAGNASSDVLAYPASLHAAGNGIVAVGARTSEDKRASYSPGRDNSKVTVFALSGDGERYDRDLVRLDPYRPHAGRFEQKGVFDRPEVQATAVEAILAPDVPGRYGYTGSSFVDPYVPGGAEGDKPVWYEPISAFIAFSGTSAATAVAAGVLSLKMATGAVARPGDGYDPTAMKSALTGGADYDAAAGLPAVSMT